MADTTTSTAPTPAPPLVTMNGGQGGGMLDPAMLAHLGLPAPAPAKPENEDGLFERSLKHGKRSRTEKTKKEYRRAWNEFKAYLAAHCDGRTPLQATDE